MLLASLLLASAAPDCRAFSEQLDRPAPVSSRALTADEIAVFPVQEIPATPTTRAGARIGELVYRGHGIELGSADPRFAEVTVDSARGPRHPCGYEVEGPGAWNALDRDQAGWTIRFVRRGQADYVPARLPDGAEATRPVLAGATAGPVWPVATASGDLLLGVMYPDAARSESLIVAFPARPGQVPVRVLARVRMHVEAFAVVPPLHDDRFAVHLLERTSAGRLRHVVLELNAGVRDEIAQAFAG